MIFSNQVSRRAQKRALEEQKGLVISNANYRQVSAAARGSALAAKIAALRKRRAALAAKPEPKAVAKTPKPGPKKGSKKGA